jgi:hypothetical protein
MNKTLSTLETRTAVRFRVEDAALEPEFPSGWYVIVEVTQSCPKPGTVVAFRLANGCKVLRYALGRTASDEWLVIQTNPCDKETRLQRLPAATERLGQVIVLEPDVKVGSALAIQARELEPI